MSDHIYKGVVDDGTMEIPIENKFGKLICNIYIRPADLSIVDRYEELTASFSDIVKPLSGVDIKNDGTATFEKDWEAVKKVEAELKRRINEFFDMDEADAIFAKRNPFSSVGGKFFAESVLECIGDIITRAIEDELKLSKARTDKYLQDLLPAAQEGNDNAGGTAAGP